jgi:hypothetical protein
MTIIDYSYFSFKKIILTKNKYLVILSLNRFCKKIVIQTLNKKNYCFRYKEIFCDKNNKPIQVVKRVNLIKK